MPQDYKQGGIRGERIITIRNVGDLDINISSMLFEDTLEPGVFEGFEVADSEEISIPMAETYNITLRFKLVTPSVKPIFLYLYSPTNFYFKLKIVVFPGNESRSFYEQDSLLFVVTLTILSTTYIAIVFRIVVK